MRAGQEETWGVRSRDYGKSRIVTDGKSALDDGAEEECEFERGEIDRRGRVFSRREQ